MQQITNSVPLQAWKDTTSWLRKSFVAWILAAIIPVGSGLLLYFFIPENATPGKQEVYGAIGALVSFILFLGLTYLVHLIIVPYRQRNELRCELLNIKEGKPSSDLEAMRQGFEKMVGLLVEAGGFVVHTLQHPNQNDTNIGSMGEVIGISETKKGEPAFLVPINGVSKLGTVSTGSVQTFTGLFVEKGDGPVFLSIPGLGYAALVVTFVRNDTAEAKFMVEVTSRRQQATKITLILGSQTAVTQLIPAGSLGFFEQVNKIAVDPWRGGSPVDMVIQIEA